MWELFVGRMFFRRRVLDWRLHDEGARRRQFETLRLGLRYVRAQPGDVSSFRERASERWGERVIGS